MTEIRQKVAVLDMNDNHPNQGIRCLRELITAQGLEPVVFEARYKNEYPSLDEFDIFIFSGGPGDPTTCLDTPWGKNFSLLIDAIRDYNINSATGKKYAFMICHSFQMLVLHWQVAEVNKRKSTSFGILPCHKAVLPLGDDVLLDGLPDPFFVVDSRDFQIVQPDMDVLASQGFEVVCLEKIREHVPYERAVMAIRFSPEIFGTQFHPEADVESMRFYLYNPEKEAYVRERYGDAKYAEMVHLMDATDAVQATNAQIIPSFLHFAVHGSAGNN